MMITVVRLLFSFPLFSSASGSEDFATKVMLVKGMVEEAALNTCDADERYFGDALIGMIFRRLGYTPLAAPHYRCVRD